MLVPGLYEQLINRKIHDEIQKLSPKDFATRDVDPDEASQIISAYLATVVQKGLDNILDQNKNALADQISLANKIIDLVKNETEQNEYDNLTIDPRAEQLLAILEGNGSNQVLEKNASDIVRPESSISQSSIFTGGAVKEPQLISELQKEIETADSIDFLVSFIKWSGLVKILKQLQAFTNSGKRLRIIATTYTGATDAKAIHELSKLPNTEI